MIKKISLILGTFALILTLAACGETKTVHCDNCTTELVIDADSNMEEDWVVYCEPCSEELFSGEDLIGDEIIPEITTAE